MIAAPPPPPPAASAARFVRQKCGGDRCVPVRCAGDTCTPLAAGYLMTWSDLLNRPRPRPQATLRYGPAAAQVVDLWLPAGAGPHPVAVLIHGGCWTKSVADRSYFAYAAEDLRRRGLAVWDIEYRGVDQAGGGYPGTYLDVGAALDLLKVEGPRRGLKLDSVVVVGHSAGGQLALWSAARRRLPLSSPLRVAEPLRIAAVVDLAGVADLERDLNTACGPEAVETMAGPPRPGGRYADTSPAALLPLLTLQMVLYGAQDVTVPPAVGAAYARRANMAGDAVQVLHPPGGHVEEVAPGSAAWEQAAAWIVALAKTAP